MARVQRQTFVDGPASYDPIVASRRTVKVLPATLTADDNGAVCFFTTAAGQLYTLPLATPGLTFAFIVRTTCTSGVHRVACTTGDFFRGTFIQSTDGTFVTAPFDANGTTHLAWEGNGSTTSGIKGDFLYVVSSGGIWEVMHAIGAGTGTESTPWKTT